jgi:SpoVK/Ycf46/Vps4 family AAA+-type ATPase
MRKVTRASILNKRVEIEDLIDEIENEANDEDSEIGQFNPTCWSISKGGEFAPSFSTVDQVPAGLYELGWNASLSTHVIKKVPVNTDELYELPSEEIKNILEDIDQFWTRREIYKQYNFIHKRGILLYGEPGCGKSGIIQLCVKHIIERMNGIVINIKDEDEVRFFSEFIPTIRKIEPTRPLIVILEDIDSLAGEDSYSTTKLLNILDGIKQIENVVYIATTNYPEKLQERITNRPARFDRRYQVEMPSIEIREAYLNSKLTKEDLERIDLPVWLELTEGMSLSHLKELVISVIVMGKDFKDAIEHLTGLKNSPRIKKSRNVGFK